MGQSRLSVEDILAINPESDITFNSIIQEALEIGVANFKTPTGLHFDWSEYTKSYLDEALEPVRLQEHAICFDREALKELRRYALILAANDRSDDVAALIINLHKSLFDTVQKISFGVVANIMDHPNHYNPNSLISVGLEFIEGYIPDIEPKKG